MYLIKNIFLLIAIVIFVSGCGNSSDNKGNIPADVVHNPKTASGKESTKGIPRISFESVVHDFGRVIEGEKITYAFKFSNSGKGDLLITGGNLHLWLYRTRIYKRPAEPRRKRNHKSNLRQQ